MARSRKYKRYYRQAKKIRGDLPLQKQLMLIKRRFRGRYPWIEL
jgi:hypothetical protein